MLTAKTTREFTALFPFCGLGAGALGFLNAEIQMFGHPARFRSLGGIDINKEACQDFETLTGSPALHGDMHELTSHDIRSFFGNEAPDVVFSSPPCTGFSGLLPARLAGLDKYQRLNQLVPRWVELMLETWDPPPRLIIMENVPRITARGKELLEEVHQMLGDAGYLVTQDYHDCGELGGLAQHRRRFLLVGRHPERCSPILYRPPIKRVRGCGEVLEELPIPGTQASEAYGALHELPKISLLSMMRLALIPAGGDWRDIPGVLKEHQKRREVHKRHEVIDWSKPSGTIAGSGSNGVSAVADPRVNECHAGVFGVRDWHEPSGTVTGRASPSTGTFAVADPRLNKAAFDHAYRVLRWGEPSFTVAGQSSPGCGAYAVADPRERPDGLFVPWDDVLHLPAILGLDPKKPPKENIVIISPDGCWHRPLTILELALLQGLPARLGRRPLKLAGNSTGRWRERIGNAVPVQTAQAIAERMLVTLSSAQEQSIELFPQNGGEYWVEDGQVRGY